MMNALRLDAISFGSGNTLLQVVGLAALYSVGLYVVQMLAPESLLSASPLLLPFFMGGGGGDGDCDGGGDAGDGDCSTPFLCTWDGNKFSFENDVLFGKPKSYFQEIESGIRLYEAGGITPDLYRIQNDVQLKNGRFVAQIREIEPEESYIDHVALARVTYPATAELVVDSEFRYVKAFDREAVRNQEGILSQAVMFNGDNVTEVLGNAKDFFSGSQKNDGRFMDADGDILEITGRVKDITRPAYLLLRAHYRDWTVGEIFSESDYERAAPIRSTFQRLPRVLFKGAAFTMSLFVLGFMSTVQSLFKLGVGGGSTQEGNRLARSFSIKEALADTPYSQGSYYSQSSYGKYSQGGYGGKGGSGGGDDGGGGGGCSLVLSYRDGKVFRTFTIFSPRYYQPTLNAVTIPTHAIQQDGSVHIKIEATKRHKIYDAVLFSPSEEAPFAKESFKVARAFHQREEKDYAEVLNEHRSGEYLRTIPSDVVDVAFDVPEANVTEGETFAYLFTAGGVYTRASESVQKEAGNWVERLDPESRAFLRDMYALRSYKNRNRTPVLS